MTTSTGRLFVLAGALTSAGCIKSAGTIDAGSSGATCVHTCTPDTGPDPVNCAADEAGLEFFPVPSSPHAIADFEQTDSTTGLPIGQYLYGYFDGTAFAHPEGTDAGTAVSYQPRAIERIRCTDVQGRNHVLHISGGPFLGWGGGIGVAMAHLNGRLGDSVLNLCVASPTPAYCPANNGDAVSVAALDLSQWDGVAVWARRGPDSQPLLRVLVGNKDTDDDISYLTDRGDPAHLQPRYCERVRECACTYLNLSCDFFTDGGAAPVVPGGGYYCGAPGAAPGPAVMAPASSAGAPTNTCDVTRCNDPYPAFPADVVDVKFAGRPCTAHGFRNGLQTSVCFDPSKDPPPAEPDQQCGDHWTAPLHLTTDWRLFKVPFTTMFQQGFAKRSSSFDLKSVSVVRLTWDAGYIDYWIDDLRFYRVRR